MTQCVLWGDVHRVQERYLGYALPLLAVAFAVRSSRPGRRPVQEIGVAAGIAVVAALVPLSGYAIYAFIRLERALGGHASTAGVFATPRRCLRPSAASAARCSCCSREVDWLEDPFVHVAPEGRSAWLHGDVVVDVSPATAVTLRDPRRVRAFGAVTLWRPVDRVRLAAIMNNRLSDGLVLRSGGARSTRPRAHGHRRGPWTGGFVASPVRVRGRQWRSPIVSVPRYVPDPAACSQIH